MSKSFQETDVVIEVVPGKYDYSVDNSKLSPGYTFNTFGDTPTSVIFKNDSHDPVNIVLRTGRNKKGMKVMPGDSVFDDINDYFNSLDVTGVTITSDGYCTIVVVMRCYSSSTDVFEIKRPKSLN